MVNFRTTDRPVNPLRYIFFGFYFVLILFNLIEYIRGKFTYGSFKKVFYYLIFAAYLVVFSCSNTTTITFLAYHF